ncbi:inhibin beta E chain-like [Arapaima gigas]
MKLMLKLCVEVGLLGLTMMKPHDLEPPDNTAASSPLVAPVPWTGRCQMPFLVEAKEHLLHELKLKRVPQLPIAVVEKLRAAFSNPTLNPLPSPYDKVMSITSFSLTYGNGDLTNTTELRCCQLNAKIFVKDLGWDSWIMLPKSFTYSQCQICRSHLDLMAPSCTLLEGAEQHGASQGPCCKPISHHFEPFVYMDEGGTLTISSVQLARGYHHDAVSIDSGPLSCSLGQSAQYCWSLQDQCRKGEQLQHAFVVLPLSPMGEGVLDVLGVRPTHPLQLQVLRPHHGLTVLSDDCGQRFDITVPLSTLLKRKPSFCVEVVPPGGILGKNLQCPPFLVTTWIPQGRTLSQGSTELT